MDFETPQFFMTYSRSRPHIIVPMAANLGAGILENAMHRWSEATESFNQMFEYNSPHAIDSGGFNCMSKYGEFPWEVSEYHNWLDQNKDEFDFAAIMDYACEDRFNHLWDVETRRKKTLENTIEHFEHEPDYKCIPVLQGRKLEDYIEFYEWLRDYGLPYDFVGVGTVCRLSSTEKIVKIINGLREKTKIDKFHGFGVKVDSFKRGALFDTADSQAWVYSASNGNRLIWNDDESALTTVHDDDSQRRTVESFARYYMHVQRLQNNAFEEAGMIPNN